MDEEYDDVSENAADSSYAGPVEGAKGPREPDKAERDLVSMLCKRVREDRKAHKKAFDRMREDMEIARRGAPKDWPESYYVANITGRHINQKVAALYAKNPKAIARRRERLDFQLWDENEQSLMLALQTVQAGMTPQMDPMTGQPVSAVDPAMMTQAMALVQDFQQGMAAREQAKRVGKTLELLFAYFQSEQTPVDFKTSMKQVVRRACTTGVAYAKIGFQRQFDQDPKVAERLADFQQQMLYVQNLGNELAESETENRDRKQRELELAITSLQEQQYVLVREGLVFDFPDSTRVIPDAMTRCLTGFVGARWLTVEYLYTPEEVKRNFGVDLGKSYTKYYDDGSYDSEGYQSELPFDDKDKESMVCVWEHYDRQAGLVYLLCDGYKGFLKQPGPPEVYVEDFWPIFALTFNEVEDPKHLFPPSDVRLMLDMQQEYNALRQGLREHRQQARPRIVTLTGMLDDESKKNLARAKPFDVVELNLAGADNDVRKALQPIQIPGVDPNLYETGQLFTDIQLVVGAQEAQFGAVAKATATESSIAESSRIASVDSNVDDMDGFLTRIARAAGQILLREMSAEQVMQIVGPGAVWPQLSLEDIARELYLEIEAGSSGKPNQAQELANWEKMLPFLIQMPGITPSWLARETLRRLDDRMDLLEALTENIPAIVALNRMAGATAGAPAPAPGAAPEDQGGAGADNAPVPGGPAGTTAPMGNNQV